MATLEEGRAALERGRPVVLVTPPAPEQAGEIWGLVSPGPTVILCADDTSPVDWAAAPPTGRRVHAVTALARTARILKELESPPDILAGGVDDLAALVTRSALNCDAVTTLVVAWPESLVAGERLGALDTLLAAMPGARRIVLSWHPAALGDFLERHARRAEVVGALPTDADGAPLPPVAPARYAVVAATPASRATALRDALDLIDPKRPLVWRGEAAEAVPPASPPPDVVFCLRLPTRQQLAALARFGPPVVFVTGAQLSYLRSIAAPLTPLHLPSAAERARDRADALRARIATLIETGPHDAELALLDSLFERFDPAEVAAALLVMNREAGSGKREASPPLPASSGAWVKVFVNVGKKDRASAKDLVGALIREVGLAKAEIGPIDVRDTFSVVDVAPAVAERVLRQLPGVTIRGRRAQARLDRYA